MNSLYMDRGKVFFLYMTADFVLFFRVILSSMFQCQAARDHLTRSFSPLMDNQTKQSLETLIQTIAAVALHFQ